MAKKKEKNEVGGRRKKTKTLNVSEAAKYKRHLELCAARQRKCKANMTEERLEAKKKRDRERYYRLKKEAKIKHVSDMNEKEKQDARKVWKKKKAEYRKKKKEEKELLQHTPPDSDVDDPGLAENIQKENKNISRQQQVGRRKVRREKSKVYRDLKRANKDNEKLQKEVAKLRKRLSRVKQKEKKKTESGVSPSPNKKVQQLVAGEKISPNIKRRLFVGYTLEKQIKENIKRVKAKGRDRHIIHKSIGSNIVRKYKMQNELRSILPYSYTRKNKESDDSLTLGYKKKTYKTIKVVEARQIKKFFEGDDVSKMLPGKKDYVKRGGVKKQRRLLLDNMKNLYEKFKKDTNCNISYTSFTRCRPYWVTPPTSRDRDTCACIKHENVNLLVSALKKINAIEYKDTSELVKSLVCSTESERCMTSKCTKCKSLDIIYKTEDENVQVNFCKWTSITEKRLIKDEEKNIKRTVKSAMSANLAEVKLLLKSQINMLKEHIHFMKHQTKTLKDTTQNLEDNQILFQLDFSQNYVAKYNTEIQSMHFGASKKQISLHTVVRHHKENDEVVAKSFCTVSENLEHRAHGVWAHFKPILEQTAETFPETKNVVIFSDSPSSQYRNKTNLYCMSTFLPSVFKNIEAFTWNFSEPGHGKGSMDGVGGSLKRNADSHVLHGRDIRCASDLVSLFENSKTTVLEVTDHEVKDMKAIIPDEINQIQGIMSVRQVTWGIHGDFNLRKLSCMACKPGTTCEHYHLKIINNLIGDNTNESQNTKMKSKQTKQKKEKMKVSEVYTSGSDSDDEQPVETSIEIQPFQCDAVSQGTFVLVTFSLERKPLLTKKFVAVVQSEIDSEREVNVMFMKQPRDKSLFYADDNDVCYISCDQICGILPYPKIIVKGNRIFYKFPGLLDL